ncbi:MAG: FMN-binding protein [Zhenhengia sp.]
MKLTRKLASLVMTTILGATVMVGCSNTNSEQAPVQTSSVSGTFEGEADGKHGAIKVSVLLENGQIADIEILETKENVVLSEPVYTKVKQTMINNNNVNVDAISGATETSNGYIAVK